MEKIHSNGQDRLIVYIGGTTPDWMGANQPVITNVPGYLGEPKDHQRQMIDLALGIDRSAVGGATSSTTEIMLVGYSQGGMDAQNIAAHAADYGYNVTTIVTYGAPLVQWPTDGVSSAHLRDTHDPVPNLSRLDADIANERFVFYGDGGTSSGTDPAGVEVHQRIETYQEVGRQFDANTDPDFTAVLQNLKAFIGEVITYSSHVPT